jgi:FtsH-binding integral membrane protein
MAKLYRILEIGWLLLTLASVGVALTFYIKYRAADSYIFWCLVPISLLMYYIRRRSRLRLSKNNPKNPS